jgi:mannitol 2-dehydrogenase
MSVPVPLSLANLPHIRPDVARPQYQRAQLSPGIVHFGIGNFHRAHLAVYLDDLMNQGLAHDFAIIGAGITTFDATMRETLKQQDWLTSIVEQEADLSSARVIGPMIDFIAPDDRTRLIDTLADPAIRIVSLTITEGGYFINPATGLFDPQDPAIRHDAANPGNPETVFGLVLAGLIKRRAKGIAPFTIMSCDNLPHNGKVTRGAVIGLAELIDPELAGWISKIVAFPNGMVDRITPATTDRERDLAASLFGIADRSPVFCEGFKQWVVEDHFPLGRPPFEKAGASFVPDVTPYELMKIRILNGGHAIIAYPGGLMDIHFVHEAMENPLIAAFLDKLEQSEIIPHVPPVPDTNLLDYLALIKRRFANPKIGDTIRRLCLDGSNRQPKFIVPSIRDRLAAGASVNGLALESALWCRYCRGVTDSGQTIAPNDPNWALLTERAKAAATNPAAWTGQGDIYGELSNDVRFTGPFSQWLAALANKGTAGVLQDYLGA